MAEFGECVLLRLPKTNREKRQNNALAERAVDGIWLGTNLKTSTSIVAMPRTRVHILLGEASRRLQAIDGAGVRSMRSKVAL